MEYTGQLYALITSYLHLVGIQADVARLAQYHAWPAEGPDSATLVQALQSLSLNVRYHRTTAAKLIGGPLPALVRGSGGQWLLIGHADKRGVLLQPAGDAPPRQMAWETFGELTEPVVEWVTARPQAAVTNSGLKGDPELAGTASTGSGFGIGWFWTSLGQYKQVMSEVFAGIVLCTDICTAHAPYLSGGHRQGADSPIYDDAGRDGGGTAWGRHI